MFGKNVKFPHNAIGTVIPDKTIIEDNVKIYQNVTIGRADIFKNLKEKVISMVHILNTMHVSVLVLLLVQMLYC